MTGRAELSRFLVVGVTAVVIDLACYRLFLVLGAGTSPAKAISFVCGAVFAFIANRDWTFRAERNVWAGPRFAALYLASLGCNVAVNSVVLGVFPAGEVGRMVAFVVATGVSATLNFVGMKWFVFTPLAQRVAR